MFLYCESIDKEQLNSKVDSIMKDIHFYEEKQKEILVLSSLNISQFTFSSLIGQSKIYKNEFYLNNYFIFAVFLLSFIVSILLALMKQKFIDKSI